MIFTTYTVFLLAPAAATLQELQAGMVVPNLTLQTLTGESRNLSDLRGKKLTLVVFWSTWSAKSEKSLVRMQKIYQSYKDQGLAVIAINADDQKITPQALVKIRAVVDRLKLTFSVLVDQGLAGFHTVGVIALPTTVVLDNERVIQYELSGYPLIGSEQLVDFLATTLDGKKPVVLVEKKTPPNKEALRLFNMGNNTLKSRRMADMAEMWFKKAIAADPGFLQPYLSLGKYYLHKGDITAAKAQFEQSLVKEPNNVVALCEMGMLLANEGKSGEGMVFFDKSMKADEAYTPCYYYRGLVLGRQGKLAEALKMFEGATINNPMDSTIYEYKALMYEEQKMQREAAEEYRKALEMVLNLN